MVAKKVTVPTPVIDISFHVNESLYAIFQCMIFHFFLFYDWDVMHLFDFIWVVFCWLFLLTIGKLPDIPTPILVSNGGEYLIIYDSVFYHKAWSISTLLTEMVLSWKGNSLDMNTVENIWEITHKKIVKKVITNKRQLREKLINVWHQNSKIKLQKHQWCSVTFYPFSNSNLHLI